MFTVIIQLNKLSFPFLPWPGYSPDMNPMKHLGDSVEKKLQKNQLPASKCDRTQKSTSIPMDTPKVPLKHSFVQCHVELGRARGKEEDKRSISVICQFYLQKTFNL